jgi:2-hydroxy-3-oxopropionate reductase
VRVDVIDTEGRFVEAARIEVASTGDSAVTDSRGRTVLGVPTGSEQVLSIASAGFAEQIKVIQAMKLKLETGREGLIGETGVAKGLSAGKTVVDMSSISPMATKQFAQAVNAVGCDYLDAPVSGGEVGAKAGSLTIMVGGPDAAFERVKPLFEAMGKNITLVGGNGDGQTTKVANQIIVALNIEAVAEALLFASKAGADPAKVRQALMGGFAASRILEVHGERMVKRTFNPGFRIELHQKDLNLALQGAKELGVSLPNTASAAQLMQSCAAHGMAGLDHSALCRSLEMMAGHEIAG